MTFYEELVNRTQMNYQMYYTTYAAGGTPYKLSTKSLPYQQEIKEFASQVRKADCVIVGGASGLSAAGGGDFYYEDNDSYKKYFGPFEKKYHFKGAFAGSMYQWDTREEYWGYMATFLHTTLTAPARKPYLDLNEIVKDKDFFVITTNQDTQFLRLYPESKVAELQGDHRFFQCSRCCHDEVWDAVKPVEEMYNSLHGGTSIPTELIPRCPHCGAEAFPWVRGYGNFLTGRKYEQEYSKASEYILSHADKKILFIELGVGRMTPMFIQEPFWNLTAQLDAHYISVNQDYAFLPKQIEDKGMAVKGDIAEVLADVRSEMEADHE